MTFESLDQSLIKTIVAYENAETDDYKEKMKRRRDHLTSEKIGRCDDLIHRVNHLYENGIVSQSYAEDVISDLTEEKDFTMQLVHPYLEEVEHAKVLSLALHELEKLSCDMMSTISASAIGLVITIPVKKFIMHRLNNYPVLHENTVSFKSFTKEKYAFSEMDRFSNIKFKYAESWLQRGVSRVDVMVWFYNKKPVMAMAYANSIEEGLAEKRFVDTVIVDTKMKRDEDYYTACMCTSKQLSHPAVMRVLKSLWGGWKKQVDTQKKLIAESAEDAYIDGTFDDKISSIMESVDAGACTKKVAMQYIHELNSALYKH